MSIWLTQPGSLASPKASFQAHSGTARSAMLHQPQSGTAHSARLQHPSLRPEHAHITEVRGQAALISETDFTNGGYGHRILAGAAIPEGFLVVTGDGDSYVELRCPDGALVRIWSNSILQVTPQDHTVFLQRGVAEFGLSKESNSSYKVRTKTIVANTSASTLCMTSALSRDSCTIIEGEAKVIDVYTGQAWHP